MAGVITQKRLKKYVSLKMERDNELKRLEQLQKDAGVSGSSATWEGDGSQRSIYVNTDAIPKAIIRKMEQEEKIAANIARIDEEMIYIEDQISDMEDPMHKEVLRLRYLDGDHCRWTPWEEVSEWIYHGVEEKHMKATYRLHGYALEALKKQTTTQECP